MNRAHKFRIYPTKEQETLLQQTFGHCRFVYNYFLERNQTIYQRRGEHLSYYQMQNLLPEMKTYLPWLKEADSQALQHACRNLDASYRRFFRKEGGFPKKKRKHCGKASYTTNADHNKVYLAKDNKAVKLPGIGIVKAKVTQTAKEGWLLKQATVSRNAAGQYSCSLLYESDMELPPFRFTETSRLGSMDYKSSGLFVDETDFCTEMPKYYRQSQKKLAREQQKLSRKRGSKKGEAKSSNWRKQAKKVARLSQHVADQRKNFLHEQSTLKAKAYDVIVVEDLSMQDIADRQDKYHLGKATYDNGYAMFLEMLAYKLEAKGGLLLKVDRYFPSSQRCSCCGYINQEVKELSVRKWVCPSCGTFHDREHNANANLLQEGLRILQTE